MNGRQTRSPSGDWVTLRNAARILDCGSMSVPRIVEAGKVRTRTLPGMVRIYYSRADLERLAAEAVSTPSLDRVAS